MKRSLENYLREDRFTVFSRNTLMITFENISFANYSNKFVKFNFLYFSNERVVKEKKRITTKNEN